MTAYLPRILITGGHGQIGMALQQHAQAKQYNVIACSHAQLNLTQPASIAQAITLFQPNIVINAAAFTAVDQAESRREAALQINHIGAKNLAIACQQHGLPLLHLSTAYIFDGQKASPYLETDTAHPINVYGESKWLGEQAITTYCEQSLILRVTSVFSEYGNNFLKTMLKLAMEKKEMQVVADQLTSPTYASDIAGAIFNIILTFNPGTYHYCNLHPVSWHAFAVAIIHEAKQYHTLAVQNIVAINTQDYKTPAKRPLNSVLDCHKIYNDYGITQTHWDVAVKKIVKTLFNKNEAK